jgi:pimeloyl-ACP methyl ester carboxylesterase
MQDTVLFGDRSVSVLEWSPTNYVSTILCLHGSCQTAHTWDDFADNLLKLSNQYRIIAVDLRGHGDSSHCDTYGINDFVNDLVTFVESKELKDYVLMGMSLGGMIVMRALIDNKLSSLPSHVIIVDITPDNFHSGAESIRSAVQESQVLDSLEDFVQWAHKFNPNRSINSLQSRLKHNLKQLSNTKWTWKYDHKFVTSKLDTDTQALRDDTWSKLSQLAQVKVLLVRGGRSNVTSQEACQRFAEVANASFVQIENAGHSVQGDAPQEFTEQVLAVINK